MVPRQAGGWEGLRNKKQVIRLKPLTHLGFGSESKHRTKTSRGSCKSAELLIWQNHTETLRKADLLQKQSVIFQRLHYSSIWQTPVAFWFPFSSSTTTTLLLYLACSTCHKSWNRDKKNPCKLIRVTVMQLYDLHSIYCRTLNDIRLVRMWKYTEKWLKMIFETLMLATFSNQQV